MKKMGKQEEAAVLKALDELGEHDRQEILDKIEKSLLKKFHVFTSTPSTPSTPINMHEEHIPLTNKSYEATLLGGLMLDNSKFDVVLERVRGCHFETQRHRNIFRVMEKLHNKKEPIDTLSIVEELKVKGYAEAEKYLFALAKETSVEAIPHLPSIANVVMMNSYKRERNNGKTNDS